jgi:SAM-dependent methyltransferase
MNFQEKYERGETGWEINRVDCNLVDVVTTTPIQPCTVLDIGCGTGNNAIWLQGQGFDVTGVDSSEFALRVAGEKSTEAGIKCSFHLLDFFNDSLPGAPFDFAFDRGCFHHPLEAGNFQPFTENVFNNLKEGGLWLTLSGNCDEKRDTPGPPQISATQIVTAVEPYFEILSLLSGDFDSNQAVPAKNWICLMRKRVIKAQRT